MKCTYVLISPPAEGVSHYQCEVCGHKRISLYPAHMLHRICPKGKGGGEANIRETIEAELQRRFDLDATKRTMEEIRTTLDKCFGGCDHMNGSTCARRGSSCRHRENWLLSIAAADCEVG